MASDYYFIWINLIVVYSPFRFVYAIVQKSKVETKFTSAITNFIEINGNTF